MKKCLHLLCGALLLAYFAAEAAAGRRVQIISVPSALGGGGAGQVDAPARLREAAPELFAGEIVVGVPPADVEDISHLKNARSIIALTERVAESVHRARAEGSIPVVVGGDGSISYGTITGMMPEFSGRLAVVCGSRFYSTSYPAMSMLGEVWDQELGAALPKPTAFQRRVAAIGWKNNRIDEGTDALWQELRNLGGVSPKLSKDRLIIIGACVLGGGLVQTLAERVMGWTNCSLKVLRRDGVALVIERSLAALPEDAPIHFKIDLSGLRSDNPEVTPGVPDLPGMTDEEIEHMVHTVISSGRVCSVDIVGLSPDAVNDTVARGTRILRQVMSLLQG